MQEGTASIRSWQDAPTAETTVDSGKPVQGAIRTRVVLVDDDDLFRESLRLNLLDHDFQVTEFDDGQGALEFFSGGGRADVVLLDWRMPCVDGLTVLKTMRAGGLDFPTIFLTVLDNEIYEEAALAGGAVDFVEKSRGFSILLRRIALITEGSKAAGGADDTSDYNLGDLKLRRDSNRAYWKERVVELTLTEFRIVALLAVDAGRDVTYREIYDLAHGKGFVAGSGMEGYRVNVRTFIKRIRQKFKDVDEQFDSIENYPGFGYRWRGADAE